MIMKNLLLNNSIVQVWRDSNSALEYVVAFWLTSLAVLAVGGWLTLVVNFILNPSMFDNVTWGLIDYIP